MIRIPQILLLVAAVAAGMWVQHLRQSSPDVAAQPVAGTPRRILYWWDPMMPEYKSDKPGKSPMGMDMVPVYEDEAEKSTVRIAPEVINNLGVRTEPAARGPLEHRIETGGFVDYDEASTTHVLAPASGRIAKLAISAVGQRVKAGDPLFVIEADGGAATTVQAPVAGVVAALEKIFNGMPTTEGADLVTLVDPRVVWIKGELFESDAAWLRIGQVAEARFRDRPGRVWRGSVQIISPKVEYSSRTVRYRMRFDNDGEFLVPNMFAEIVLHADVDGEVIHIPRQALIRDGAATRVIVGLGDGRFTPRDVTVGAEVGDRIEIRSGLAEGEQVVYSAQFLIDSEASLQQSLQRLQPTDSTASDHQHHHP